MAPAFSLAGRPNIMNLRFAAIESVQWHGYYASMAILLIPYAGERPASININGHRIVILGQDNEVFSESLSAIGADSIKELEIGDSSEEQAQVLNDIARESHAGLVIAPSDVLVEDLLKNLEVQLPWIQ
jgi:hypothetical protein